MDADQKELVRHLFSKASEFAEAAHDTAVKGQSARFKSTDYVSAAERLRDAARGMQNIADAIITIIDNKCD